MSMILDVEWAERLGSVLTDAGVQAMLGAADRRPTPVCSWTRDAQGRLSCHWRLPDAASAGFAAAPIPCMLR